MQSNAVINAKSFDKPDLESNIFMQHMSLRYIVFPKTKILI